MNSPVLQTAVFIAGALAPISCGGAPNSTTPDATVMKSVQALRDNDLDAFLHCAFTEVELADFRAEWASRMLEAPEADEKARFAMTMTMLTAQDAEKTLMLKVEPELAKMKSQVDLMLGMIEGMAASAMASNSSLSAQEQEQARQWVQALVATLRQNDITDPERARRAVGFVCTTARMLKLKTIEDVQRLNFDQAIGRGDLLLAGTKDFLAVYGFSMDGLLASVKARTVTQSGDIATVEIRYKLLGVEHTQKAEMIRTAGHWVVRRDAAASAGELKSGIGG